MFASIDIDHRLIQIEIKKINTKTANPSRLTTISRRVNELANLIKKDWHKFSDQEREELKNLAYQLIETPQGLQKIWLNVWAKFYLIFIVLTNQIEALYSCQEAIDTLVDNILDAVERENPVYQQVLSDTLEELNSNRETGELVDGKRAGEWLQQLSNQAIKEV